jgi:hypothetical protein
VDRDPGVTIIVIKWTNMTEASVTFNRQRIPGELVVSHEGRFIQMRTNRIGLEPRRQPGGPEVLHP